MEHEMAIKMNDTSCFENRMEYKQMWGITLTDYNSTLTNNALMTIMGKTRASKSFWFMRYERSSEQMEQEMAIKINDTSCFENWIALKWMWEFTLANYNIFLTDNALLIILGKTRASKSFWFVFLFISKW